MRPMSESAPVRDVDVTPEMIEAGASALASYSDACESLEEAAERIFREMLRASEVVAN